MDFLYSLLSPTYSIYVCMYCNHEKKIDLEVFTDGHAFCLNVSECMDVPSPVPE
jgi:hypothetical protein